MPEQVFTIKGDSLQTLEIKYKGMGSDVKVRLLGGRDIAHFDNARDLLGGKILKTPVGDISVEYKIGYMGISSSGFSVWYNGELLEGSVDHPVLKWRTGYRAALFLGVLNTLLGLYVITNEYSFLASVFAGPFTLGFGIVLFLLGLWSWKGRAAIPLIIAALLFGADGALGLLATLSAQGSPNIFMLMVRIAFVAMLWRGGTGASDLGPEIQYTYEKAKNRY